MQKVFKIVSNPLQNYVNEGALKIRRHLVVMLQKERDGYLRHPIEIFNRDMVFLRSLLRRPPVHHTHRLTDLFPSSKNKSLIIHWSTPS